MLAKLFRKKPLAELLAEAQALEGQGEHGAAKLTFDRAAARAEREDPASLVQAQEGASRCCDAIAERRLAEGQLLGREGKLELARAELRHALETARDEALKQRIRDAAGGLEARDAIAHAEVTELSDEERLSLIVGAWEPEQAAELEPLLEQLTPALLAESEEDARAALPALEGLLVPGSRYLWLELARTRLLATELTSGEQALRKFLELLGAEQSPTPRLLAYRELARLAHERGDRDAALAELERAAEALEDDPRPLLDLGSYLRALGRPGEAVEVLELCVQAFGDERVEWPVLNELGTAYAEAGNDDRAVAVLEHMLEGLASKSQFDFPPQGTLALAKIWEKRGNLARSADLYRALAEGSDSPRLGHYHQEAARVLSALGLSAEAERMLKRATALEGHG